MVDLKCRNCSNPKLIKAHIIPEGFGRIIRGEGANVSVTTNLVREARPQLGEYDPEILCASCDNVLGIFDSYAIDVCNDFEKKHRRQNEIFELANFDGEQFTKFILAVLWRASISKRPSFNEIALGPYEGIIREVLFGEKPLKELRQFQLLVQRYESAHLDMKGIYTLPVRREFNGLNAYGFMLSGFRIFAKLDNRPFRPEYTPFVMNSASTPKGFFLKFEETLEFQQVKRAAVNHLIRTQGKPSKL